MKKTYKNLLLKISFYEEEDVLTASDNFMKDQWDDDAGSFMP